MRYLIAILLSSILSCTSHKEPHKTVRTDSIDPDIVLINIGDNTNRSEIAEMLNEINECYPLIVGVDIFFSQQTDSIQESALGKSLQQCNNLVLAFGYDTLYNEMRSESIFRRYARGEGYVNSYTTRGITDQIMPVMERYGAKSESFSTVIAKLWKPELGISFENNKVYPLLFFRDQSQFIVFDKSSLKDKGNCGALKNKIVLIGYLGPGESDKFLVPLSDSKSNQTDNSYAYGLVVQANAIRTILYYAQK